MTNTLYFLPKHQFFLLVMLLLGIGKEVTTTTAWLITPTPTTALIPANKLSAASRTIGSSKSSTSASVLYYRSESSSSPEEGLTDDDSAMSRWLMSLSNKQQQQQQQQQSSSSLLSTTQEKEESQQSTSTITSRAMIQGVSLAPTGFYVILRLLSSSLASASDNSNNNNNNNKNYYNYIPFQITNDVKDSIAATSTESLTMIQLLSGVDMAGAILPPDILAKLIVLYCESIIMKDEDVDCEDEYQVTAQNILAHVQKSLPNSTVSYSEVHEWFQSRVKLPEASLDEVTIAMMPPASSTSASSNNNNVNDMRTKFTLSCQIRNYGTLKFEPTQDMLQSVLYQYTSDNNISSTFTALSLALRYQAPITMKMITTKNEHLKEEEENEKNNDNNSNMNCYTMEEIETLFPMYKCRTSLQQSNIRVAENIVRSFEIHKLTGALRIAKERNDVHAIDKIRKALDEYDNMDDLPTMNMSNDLNSNLHTNTNTNNNNNNVDDDDDANGDDDDFTLDAMQ